MARPSKTELRAGAAVVDITPTRTGLRLGGHAGNRLATGVLDPLKARALHLESRAGAVTLVVLDLVGLQKLWVDRIRAGAGAANPRSVLVFTTHTHDSPDTLGYFGYMPPGTEIPVTSGLDREYLEYVIERSAAAARAARWKARPATLAASRIKTPNKGLTRNVRREGYKEDEIVCLRAADAATGETIAVVTNYPCHPEMLGRANTLASAEFLTPFHERVESLLGGTSLFIQGALGGMVTGAVSRDDGTFDGEVGAAFNPVLAARLADYVAEAVEHRERAIRRPSIRLLREEVRIPVDNWKFLAAGLLGILPRESLDWRTRTAPTEVNLLSVGPLRLVTMPGETLPEMGFALKAMLDCPFPVVASLGCDELGYLLPRSYFRDPNYAYECSMSVGPLAEPILAGAARRLVARLAKD